VELDTTGIRAAVTRALLAAGAPPPGSALLAVGALPPGSALLTRPADPAPSDWQAPLTDQENSAGRAVRLPLNQATAVIENITVHKDRVTGLMSRCPPPAG